MWKFDEFWEIITLDLMRVDIGENSQNSPQEYLNTHNIVRKLTFYTSYYHFFVVINEDDANSEEFLAEISFRGIRDC